MPFIWAQMKRNMPGWMKDGASIWPQVMVDSLFQDHGYFKTSDLPDMKILPDMKYPANDPPNQLLSTDLQQFKVGFLCRLHLRMHFYRTPWVLQNSEDLHFIAVAGQEEKHPLPLDFFFFQELWKWHRRSGWFIKPWFL